MYNYVRTSGWFAHAAKHMDSGSYTLEALATVKKVLVEGLRTMRNLARNMAWFLKCKEAGEKAGITPPEAEEVIRTNFIR